MVLACFRQLPCLPEQIHRMPRVVSLTFKPRSRRWTERSLMTEVCRSRRAPSAVRRRCRVVSICAGRATLRRDRLQHRPLGRVRLAMFLDHPDGTLPHLR